MFEAKYLDIADELESKIAGRKWKRRLPGVATLSRELGVNSRTISKALRVLSDKGKIEIKPSSGTFICREQKKTQPYGTIGILGLLHGDKRQAELLVIEEEAKKQGYHVLNVEHCKEVFQAKPDVLLNIPVDGFIFTNSVLTPNMVADLTRAGIPFVSVNRISNLEGVSWVDFDHETAHTEILEHLLGLGHRRIAYVSFRANIEEHGRRIRDFYRNVLQPRGCYEPMLYIDDGDMNDYYKRYGEHYCSVFGMEKASYLMSMNPRPTAVIVGHHAMAYGFCNQVQKMGLGVPEDVSVVAMSQNHQEAQREKFLTMLAGSIRRRAKRAADILLERIASPQETPVQELMEMDVILRNSTGPCGKQEKNNHGERSPK